MRNKCPSRGNEDKCSSALYGGINGDKYYNSMTDIAGLTGVSRRSIGHNN